MGGYLTSLTIDDSIFSGKERIVSIPWFFDSTNSLGITDFYLLARVNMEYDPITAETSNLLANVKNSSKTLLILNFFC